MFTPTPLTRTLAAALRDLGSRRPDVRASAARDLGLVARETPEEATDALVAALGDVDSRVRGEAALALGALGAARAADALAPLLDDVDSTVRQYAAVALGQVGGERAREILDRALASDEADVRYQAMLAVAAGDARRGAEVALGLLGDDDVWIASEAALQVGAAIAARGEGGGVDAAFVAKAKDALGARVEGADAGRVALCAALALAAAGDARGAGSIAAFVRGEYAVEASDDAGELRVLAIERLGALGGADARAALEPIARRLFGSAERDAAVAALARAGDAWALERIAGMLRSRWAGQREAGVALAAAARAQGLVGDLVAVLDARRADAGAVVAALRAIGGDAAQAALARAAGDSGLPEDVREAAREG